MDTLQQSLRKAEENKFANSLEKLECLNQLAAYECWNPWLRIKMSDFEKSHAFQEKLDILKEIFQVHFAYLNDSEKALQTFKKILEDYKLPFKDLWHHLLAAYPVDANKQENYLLTFYPDLKSSADKISCLEALAYLYEKRLFKREKLPVIYEEILEADSHNLKALRFFKMFHYQTRHWDEVLICLEKLYQANAKDSEARARVALEMVNLYLYELDNAEKAKEKMELEKLDTKFSMGTIKYEIAQKNGQWKECLSLLQEYKKDCKSEDERGVLFYRMAQMQQKMGFYDESLSLYDEAFRVKPDFLEALEEKIYYALSQKDWKVISESLKKMTEQMKDQANREKLQYIVEKMSPNDGSNHAW